MRGGWRGGPLGGRDHRESKCEREKRGRRWSVLSSLAPFHQLILLNYSLREGKEKNNMERREGGREGESEGGRGREEGREGKRGERDSLAPGADQPVNSIQLIVPQL